MALKELRDEVAVALLERIKQASEDASHQHPEALKALAEAYATVAEAAPKRAPNSSGAFAG